MKRTLLVLSLVLCLGLFVVSCQQKQAEPVEEAPAAQPAAQPAPAPAAKAAPTPAPTAKAAPSVAPLKAESGVKKVEKKEEKKLPAMSGTMGTSKKKTE